MDSNEFPWHFKKIKRYIFYFLPSHKNVFQFLKTRKERKRNKEEEEEEKKKRKKRTQIIIIFPTTLPFFPVFICNSFLPRQSHGTLSCP